jgi:hypothetical protein
VNTIQTNIATVFGKRGPTRMLPTIDLTTGIDPQTGMPGTPCRQSPYRALDAAGVSQQVKLAAASWPEQHQRYYLIYFNNLKAALPQSLTQSFDDFTQTIMTPPPPGDFQAYLWGWGPSTMISSYPPWAPPPPPAPPLPPPFPPPQAWDTADDPTFLKELTDYATTQLPLISEIQDPNQPVSLLSSADAQQYDGGFIRLCTVSITPPVNGTPLEMVGHDADGAVTILPAAAQYLVKKDDPPAYLMNLPPVWAVPDVGFTAHSSEIHYEICTRYCDHPFVAQSGSTVTSGWMDSPYCLGPPA